MSEVPSILLVDDDDMMLAFLAAVLEGEGYKVDTLEDGHDAWKHIQHSVPSLIICDYMLPGLDGNAFLNKLRSHNRFRHVPFIMLTGNADPANMIKNLDGGADDYLIKPVAPEELVKRVRAVLDKQSTGPSLQGNLRNLPLPDLLQLLNQNRRTGFLQVHQGAEHFIFSIDNGDLFAVENAARTARGRKAVFRALAHDEGDFAFHSHEKLPAAGAAEQSRQEGLASVGFLCMEGLRVRDELPMRMAAFPDANPLFQPTFGVVIEEIELTPLEAQIYNLIERDIRAVPLQFLLDALPDSIDMDVVESLVSMEQKGIIEVLTPTESMFDLPAFPQQEEDGHLTSIARESNILSYNSFVRNLLLGNVEKTQIAIQDALEDDLTPELVYHRMLSAAVIDILRFDKQAEGQIEPRAFHQEVLQAALDKIWPMFSGRPPLQGTIVLSWPSAPSVARVETITWLRAAGFGVFELSTDLPPSRLFEAVINSGSSLLCMIVEHEEAAQRLFTVQRFFERWNYENIKLLAAGSYLFEHPGATSLIEQKIVAKGLFDFLRKSFQLMKIPFDDEAPARS